LPEDTYLKLKIKTDGVKIKHQPVSNIRPTGSNKTPAPASTLSITGIEITFEGGPKIQLIEWEQVVNSHDLTI